jgi:hypothetical protein
LYLFLFSISSVAHAAEEKLYCRSINGHYTFTLSWEQRTDFQSFPKSLKVEGLTGFSAPFIMVGYGQDGDREFRYSYNSVKSYQNRPVGEKVKLTLIGLSYGYAKINFFREAGESYTQFDFSCSTKPIPGTKAFTPPLKYKDSQGDWSGHK